VYHPLLFSPHDPFVRRFCDLSPGVSRTGPSNVKHRTKIPSFLAWCQIVKSLKPSTYRIPGGEVPRSSSNLSSGMLKTWAYPPEVSWGSLAAASMLSPIIPTLPGGSPVSLVIPTHTQNTGVGGFCCRENRRVRAVTANCQLQTANCIRSARRHSHFDTHSAAISQPLAVLTPVPFYNPFISPSYPRYHPVSLSCHNTRDSLWSTR
jgi:hypothetical protein